MLIYIFLSIKLHKGRKFIINTTKRCLFRLIKLKPVQHLFLTLGGKLFLSSYTLHVGAFLSVWNCSSVFFVVILDLSLFSSSQSMGSDLFLKKLSKHLCIWSDKWINRLHDANEPFAKDINIKAVSRSPQPGYHELCEIICIFHVVQRCCKHNTF